MPMGKPVPAQDPISHLPPITPQAARAANKGSTAPCAPDGYSGGSK